jgi:hypothetical protein
MTSALLGLAMGDDGGARILEGFAAGDVVEVMVAVDEVLDGGALAHFLDLVDVLLAALGPAIGHRVGSDHAFLGDDEDGLVVAVPEDVDVVRSVHFPGLDLGALRRG